MCILFLLPFLFFLWLLFELCKQPPKKAVIQYQEERWRKHQAKLDKYDKKEREEDATFDSSNSYHIKEI